MDAQRFKVVYVLGSSRSGSTLISNVLGLNPQYFWVGELNFLWERGISEQRKCGCGRIFGECSFWSKILANKNPLLTSADIAYMQQQTSRLNRIWQIPFTGFFQARILPKEFISRWEDIYHAVSVETNMVIIDSSKHPMFCYLLSVMQRVDLYVIHLVRDPRAVAHSLQRKKIYENHENSTVYMKREWPLIGLLRWIAWNYGIRYFLKRRIKNYKLLRYEDFVTHPRATMAELDEFIEEEATDYPFTGAHDLVFGPNHAISGNPIRFNSGLIKIKADTEWQEGIPRLVRVMYKILRPLFSKYGY